MGVSLFFLLLGFWFTGPIWSPPTWWGIHDWPQFYAWHGIPRITLLEYRQFPLWNPYLLGGAPELAHTHSPFLSPFFAPVLLAGPVVGLKVSLVLYLAAGMIGMFRLARHLQCHPLACLLGAVLWGFNGHLAAHAAVGHVDHLPFYLLPWIVLFFLRQRIVWAGVGMTLLFFSGGPYPFLTSAGFLTLLAVCQGIACRSWSPVRSLLCIGLLTAGLSAVKTLPCLEFFLKADPILPDFSSCDLSTLKEALLSSQWELKARVRDNLGSWEYSAHMGWIALGLGIFSLFKLDAQGWAILIPGLLTLSLAMGQQDPLRIFPLLQRIPLLKSFHVPFRLITFSLFSWAAVLSIGLTHWMKRLPKLTPVFALLGLGMFTELLLVNQAKFNGIFTEADPGPVSPGEFQQIRIGRDPENVSDEELVEEAFHRRMYLALLQGHGVVDAYDPLHLPLKAHAIGDPAYRGEFYLEKGSGSAAFESWSPNRLELTAQAQAADHLVVNQNYDSGWRVLKGPVRRVVPVDGLLGVPIPAGDWKIVLIYLPTSVLVGAGISVLTLGLIVQRRLTARRTAQAIRSNSV